PDPEPLGFLLVAVAAAPPEHAASLRPSLNERLCSPAVEDAAAGVRAEHRAGDGDGAERLLDRVEGVERELDIGSGDVLVDLLGAARSDDRSGQLGAAEHPGER